MLLTQFPDREIIVNGKNYLYFGGTSYLGIATHPKFREQLSKNLKKWGTFYGSSRSANVQLKVYDDFEVSLAKQIGAESLLTISSGTLAGRLTVDFLAQNSYSFYHYPKTHPAILEKNSKPLFIDGKLHADLLNDFEEEIVITADTILGLEVNITDFSFLTDISTSKKITLLIDESHSLGVFGKNKMGVFNSISAQNIIRKIAVSSLGKGLGLSGGIIASDKNFINQIKKETLFVSSSAANPAYLKTYLETQNIYREQQERLHQNLMFLHQNLPKNKKLLFAKNYPVLYSQDNFIFEYLQKNNIIISNFKYPTYKKMMNRIVITANHTHKDLEKLVNLLHHI